MSPYFKSEKAASGMPYLQFCVVVPIISIGNSAGHGHLEEPIPRIGL